MRSSALMRLRRPRCTGGDEGCVVRKQKRHSRADLGRFTEPAQRMQSRVVLLSRGRIRRALPALDGHPGPEGARHDGVRADAERAVLGSNLPIEGVDTSLCRRIDEGLRKAADRLDRADGHDRTPTALQEVADRLAAAPDDTYEIDVEQAVHVRLRQGMGCAGEIDPGVVHPAGELAELRGDAACRLARRAFGDVAHHRDNLTSCLTHERFEPSLVDIDRGDCPPLTCELERDRASESRRGAGDDA